MKINQAIPEYLIYLRVVGRSPYTIRNAKYGLRDFGRYLEEEQITHVDGLTREVIEEYQTDLSFRITGKGKPLTLRTQGNLLGVVKNFCRYMVERDYLVHDPAEKIRLPKKPKVLPRLILNQGELQRMMDAPDIRTNQGYRNRIILELLYDCGIRRAEVARIKLADLDLESGYIKIHGKGSKERVVPVSGRVFNLIGSYIEMIRHTFLQGKDEGYLILNRWGGKMNENGIWAVVKRCADLSGIKKNITTHTFRHTCATHMLKHGAPIRHVQELLGHESLESTQIYTRVTINDLKEIHARCHPSETMMEMR
ncbi:MAG: tyrosine-type recombinase/integrase [Proteobacteria bacterium]|nr:tyrosine-type recombinase/integrase [Pseudomonadota bacterium]